MPSLWVSVDPWSCKVLQKNWSVHCNAPRQALLKVRSMCRYSLKGVGSREPSRRSPLLHSPLQILVFVLLQEHLSSIVFTRVSHTCIMIPLLCCAAFFVGGRGYRACLAVVFGHKSNACREYSYMPCPVNPRAYIFRRWCVATEWRSHR